MPAVLPLWWTRYGFSPGRCTGTPGDAVVSASLLPHVRSPVAVDVCVRVLGAALACARLRMWWVDGWVGRGGTWAKVTCVPGGTNGCDAGGSGGRCSVRAGAV